MFTQNVTVYSNILHLFYGTITKKKTESKVLFGKKPATSKVLLPDKIITKKRKALNRLAANLRELMSRLNNHPISMKFFALTLIQVNIFLAEFLILRILSNNGYLKNN